MVVERRAPLGSVEFAVAGVYKEQRHEHYCGHDGHTYQEEVECVGIEHKATLTFSTEPPRPEREAVL